MELDVAYRSGFMMASMGIAYAGVDGTILEVNPAFAGMLGYHADQRHKLIGRTLFSLSTPQDMQVSPSPHLLRKTLLALDSSRSRPLAPLAPGRPSPRSIVSPHALLSYRRRT